MGNPSNEGRDSSPLMSESMITSLLHIDTMEPRELSAELLSDCDPAHRDASSLDPLITVRPGIENRTTHGRMDRVGSVQDPHVQEARSISSSGTCRQSEYLGLLLQLNLQVDKPANLKSEVSWHPFLSSCSITTCHSSSPPYPQPREYPPQIAPPSFGGIPSETKVYYSASRIGSPSRRAERSLTW